MKYVVILVGGGVMSLQQRPTLELGGQCFMPCIMSCTPHPIFFSKFLIRGGGTAPIWRHVIIRNKQRRMKHTKPKPTENIHQEIYCKAEQYKQASIHRGEELFNGVGAAQSSKQKQRGGTRQGNRKKERFLLRN